MRPVLVLFSILVASAPALANSGPPPMPAWRWYLLAPDKKDKALDIKTGRVIENAPVSVTFRHDVKRPQMIIPKKMISNDAPAAGAKEEEAAANGPRNLFAGLALSAAFVTGGFWFMRRSGKSGKVLLVLFVVSSGMFVSPFLSDLIGNEPAPPKIKGPPALDALKIDGNTAKLGMDIVIANDGDRILLVLPKQLLPATMIPAEEFTKPARRFENEK
ncbi:MAG TPA: hypothetical protein VFE62_21145 [Gemmataceae bacterium]|nr:hypothetical protein [Gemmataceae bacterium]